MVFLLFYLSRVSDDFNPWYSYCFIYLQYQTPLTRSILIILQDTFSRAKSWVKELQRQASPNIVIALSGNKADLANKRMVEFEASSFHNYVSRNVL